MWDQQGTTHASSKSSSGHITRFPRRSANESAGKASSHPSGPHGLASEVCSRLQTADAGEGRGILSSWSVQRCQVQKVADQ